MLRAGRESRWSESKALEIRECTVGQHAASCFGALFDGSPRSFGAKLPQLEDDQLDARCATDITLESLTVPMK